MRNEALNEVRQLLPGFKVDLIFHRLSFGFQVDKPAGQRPVNAGRARAGIGRKRPAGQRPVWPAGHGPKRAGRAATGKWRLTMVQNSLILRHLIIHFPRSSGVSGQVSEQMSARWSKRSNECFKRMSEWMNEWPSTYVPILVCSGPSCNGRPKPPSTMV